jgi:hypothetical protein
LQLLRSKSLAISFSRINVPQIASIAGLQASCILWK